MLWCGCEIGGTGPDPTNAALACDARMMLAGGCDYTGVAPMDGVILGSGGQRMEVAVSVLPVGN